MSDQMQPPPRKTLGDTILRVNGLKVDFETPLGTVRAIDGASFDLRAGETLAILGESGSGKSVSAAAVMGLVPSPPGRISGGEVLLQGRDLVAMSAREMRRVQGDRIAMVFQDAITSLNPGLTVGYQIAEPLRVKHGLSRKAARKRAIALMERVQIASAAQRVDDYPHQFSGGMSQRVMIAMALALDPEILIADEPTTALDVTVQAQIMDLLQNLQRETGMAIILITHDIGVAAEMADRVAVMYAGRIVESGPVRDILYKPSHPYTIGLMDSIPTLEQKFQRLRQIEGAPPVMTALPKGCAFHPRCARATDLCRTQRPEVIHLSPQHGSACHFAKEVTRE